MEKKLGRKLCTSLLIFHLPSISRIPFPYSYSAFPFYPLESLQMVVSVVSSCGIPSYQLGTLTNILGTTYSYILAKKFLYGVYINETCFYFIVPNLFLTKESNIPPGGFIL